MRNVIVAAVILAGLAACASTPSTRALVVRAAPTVSEFRFDDTPALYDARDFGPWAAMSANNAAEAAALERCIADRDACDGGHLLRYRRLLELAAELPREEQLELVQEYFNAIDQKLQRAGADDWASLYRVAATNEGDCKAIALAKYFTLRRLGFEAEDLRLVMEWDDREDDWHALLAVRGAEGTYMLDSILGLQEPRSFPFAYMVYSISENGIWDHAPDFVPVP